jgi:hypothetical protein
MCVVLFLVGRSLTFWLARAPSAVPPLLGGAAEELTGHLACTAPYLVHQAFNSPFACLPARGGEPSAQAGELMGHATIAMTMSYAHLSPDTRREAVSVLDRPLAPACDIRAAGMEEAAK